MPPGKSLSATITSTGTMMTSSRWPMTGDEVRDEESIADGEAKQGFGNYGMCASPSTRR
jgi:hypothetical protein